MPQIKSSHYEVIFTAHGQIPEMAEIRNCFEQALSDREGLAAIKEYINKNSALKKDPDVKKFFEQLNMRHQIDVDQSQLKSEISKLKEKIAEQKKTLVDSKEKMQGTLAILIEVNGKSKHLVSDPEIKECQTILNDLTELEESIDKFSKEIDIITKKFELANTLLSTESISVETQPSSLEKQQTKFDELEVEIAEKKSFFLALSNQITESIYDRNQSFSEKIRQATDKLSKFISEKENEIEEAEKKIDTQTNLIKELTEDSSKIENSINQTKIEIINVNNAIKDLSGVKKNELISKKLDLTKNIDQEKTKLTQKKTEFIEACHTLKKIVNNQIEKRNQKTNNSQKNLERAKRIIKWSDKEDKRHFFIPKFIVTLLRQFINDIEEKLNQEINSLNTTQQSLNLILENHSNYESTQLTDISNLSFFSEDPILSAEENTELNKKIANFTQLNQEKNEKFISFLNYQISLEENEQGITNLDNQVIELAKKSEELLKKENQLLIEKEKNETALKYGDLSLTELNQKIDSLKNDKEKLQTPYTVLFKSINQIADSPLIELLYAPIKEDEKLRELTDLVNIGNQNFHDPVIKNNISANPIYHAVNRGTAAMLAALLNALPKEENKNALDALAHDRGNEVQTALHRAIELDDLTKITLLVKAGADINLTAPGKNGMTPLLYAYTQRKSNLVDYFMAQNGINLNAVDSQNQNLMHWSALQGDQAMLEKLLGKTDSTTINQRNSKGQTALTLAAIYAPNEVKYEIIQKLVRIGAKSTISHSQSVNQHLNFTDKNHNNFLHRAILDADHKLSGWLMKRNLSSLLNGKNNDGLTPLALAVKCNFIHTVNQLLKLPNLKQDTILNALQQLIETDNPNKEIIDLLLNSDKVNLSNYCYRLLEFCLIQNKSDLTENKKILMHRLIEKIPTQFIAGYAEDLFEKPDADGNNLFHLAVRQGDSDIVKQMVSKKGQTLLGKNPLDQQNKNGDTALHFAITQKNDELIELLLNNGADPKISNQAGKTAFSSLEGQAWLVAEQAKNSISYQKMIDAGIPIPSPVATIPDSFQQTPQPTVSEPSKIDLSIEQLTKKDASGNTLLHTAVTQNNFPLIDTIEILIEENKINTTWDNLIHSKNNFNETPLHLAVRDQNIELTKFLLNKGADISLKNNDNKTPWDMALALKNVDLVHLFITRDFPIFDAINAIDFNDTQERQFWLAVLENTSAQSREEILYAMDKNGNTLLHAAILQKDEPAVTTLIQQGAEINFPNQHKQSAYRLAIARWENEQNAFFINPFDLLKSDEDYPEYRIAIQLQKKLNSTDRQFHLKRYQTIIENQSRVIADLGGSIAKLAENDITELKTLIKQGTQHIDEAKAMLKKNKEGALNPLANTQILNQHTQAIAEIITQLKEKMANLAAEKARDPWYTDTQRMLLHNLVKKGLLTEKQWKDREDILRNSINTPTNQGQGHTPLQLAVAFAATGLPEDQAKSLAMVKILIAQGADLNAHGTESKVTDSALHIAVKVGAIDVVSYLLAQPTINLSLKDSQGKTALDLLAQRQDEAAIAMTKLFLAMNRIPKDVKKTAITEAKNHKNETMSQLLSQKASKKETSHPIEPSDESPVTHSRTNAFAALRAPKKPPGGEHYPGVFSKPLSDDTPKTATPHPVTPEIHKPKQ